MSRIAICAPAKPLAREDAKRVEQIARARFPDLRLEFLEQCHENIDHAEGHFAGPDDHRLAAFLACANDPEVDAVWFARGGYGSNRIAADAVAGLTAAAKDKLFLGYSDTGYLLGALYRAGIGKPVHGPMPGDIGRDGGEAAIVRALEFLNGGRAGLEPSLDDRPTVAFNLMTLAMLCGTDLMPDLSDHVVMVEEVDEKLYAIDRLFFHVTQHLGNIAELRLGRVADAPNDIPFKSTAEEIARDWCGRAGIRFGSPAGIGHDSDNKIVPFAVAGRGRGS